MSGTFPKFLSPFEIAVAQEIVRNTNGSPYLVRAQFGRTDSIGTTASLISSIGGSQAFNTAPQYFRIRAGGHAQDNPAGSGARVVRLYGLSETDMTLDYEDVETNGAGASAYTTKKFWRINRADVFQVGNYGASNLAAMVIEDEDGDAHLGIPLREGSSQYCAYSVPSDHVCLVRGIDITVQTTKSVNFLLYVRENLDVLTGSGPSPALVKRNYPNLFGVSHLFDYTKAPLVVPGKSDIYLNALVGSGISSASATMYLALIPTK
jgi:hypothetical protein